MKYLSTLLLAGLLLACQSNDRSSTPEAETTKITETSDKIVEKRGDMTITKIKPTGNGDDLANKEVIGIYFSATVYAGSTDYFFKNPIGETFSFRQTNIVEEQTFKLPTGMLDTASEGLPSADKTMIGKRFRINYGAEGQVTAVQLLN